MTRSVDSRIEEGESIHFPKILLVVQIFDVFNVNLLHQPGEEEALDMGTVIMQVRACMHTWAALFIVCHWHIITHNHILRGCLPGRCRHQYVWLVGQSSS